MKFGMHITITAVVLTIASAGVLSPIYGGVSELEEEVAALQAEEARGATIMAAFKELEQQQAQLDLDIAGRQFRLCPNEQEAILEFESTLVSLINQSGLEMIRFQGQPKPRNDTFRYLAWDLVVQGDAYSLDSFLVSLEALDWVSRVMSLSIGSGEDVREITLKIAVMLEQEEAA